MKYFIYSIFLHFIIVCLLIGFADRGDEMHLEKENQITVDLISIEKKTSLDVKKTNLRSFKKAVNPKTKAAVSKIKTNQDISETLTKNSNIKNNETLVPESPHLKVDKVDKVDLEPSTDFDAEGESFKLSYAQDLKLFLEKNKFYPRQAIRLKQSGIVKVKVKIDANGNFQDIKLLGPSRFPILNKAAVKLLKRLGKFKPLPSSIKANSSFTIPISYIMAGGR